MGEGLHCNPFLMALLAQKTTIKISIQIFFTLWFPPQLHPECLSVQKKKDDYDPLSDSSQSHCQVSFGRKTELTHTHKKKALESFQGTMHLQRPEPEDKRTDWDWDWDWRRVLALLRASDAERPLLACLSRTPSTSRVAPSPGGPASPWTTGSCRAAPQKQKEKSDW